MKFRMGDPPGKFGHATEMVAVPVCGDQIVDLRKAGALTAAIMRLCISRCGRAAVSGIDQHGLARRCHEKRALPPSTSTT